MKVLKISTLNKIYDRNKHLNDLEFLNAILDEFQINFDIPEEDLKRLPKDGPYITISNHPLGGIDGLLLLKLMLERDCRGDTCVTWVAVGVIVAGVYVKTTVRRRGDKEYSYLSLIEAVRVEGKVTHRTLLRLGEVSELRSSGQLDRIIASLQAHADGTWLPAGGLAGRHDPSLARYLWDRRVAIAAMSARHLWLAAVSLAGAILVGVSGGVALSRTRWAEPVTRGVGVLQTVPGIALLAFMLPVLGIGTAPAVAALFLYSLYPIVRNTVTGVRGADRGVIDAAEALGMTPWQVLSWVRVPLAIPVIMAGIRTAAVVNVGTATLAAFVGGGGLGDPIVAGLALADSRMVLSGAIPAAALAVLVDVSLAGVQRALTPGALRERLESAGSS